MFTTDSSGGAKQEILCRITASLVLKNNTRSPGFAQYLKLVRQLDTLCNNVRVRVDNETVYDRSPFFSALIMQGKTIL